MTQETLAKIGIGVLSAWWLANVFSTKKSRVGITLVGGKMQKRGCDGGGCGNYGARRDGGSRLHLGIDILCIEGAQVFTPFSGIVQRLVDPYGDGKFSGLQIFVPDRDLVIKVMYMQPLQNLIGQTVRAGELIGYAQDVSKKYPSVKPHLHFETILKGKHVDPERFIKF